MFGIGETELLIIVAFGFMIFGPDKLPGMGRTIGRALRQFRQAQEGFTEVVQTEVMDPLQEAMGDPLDTGTRKQRRATAEERAAALAQDADIDTPEAKASVHKESFAERKARLAAEKKAREEKKAAELEAAQAADEDLPEEQVIPDEQKPEAPAEAEAPDTSAAALYSMGGRSSSFRSAKEREAEEKARKAAEEEAKKAEEAARKAAEEAATEAEEAAETVAAEADEAAETVAAKTEGTVAEATEELADAAEEAIEELAAEVEEASAAVAEEPVAEAGGEEVGSIEA